MPVNAFEEKILRILDTFTLQIKFMGDIQNDNATKLAQN